MPSLIWGRDPQEAIEEPYEYECQDQFCREASTLLNKLSSELEKYTMTFSLEDRSIDKAVWMLQNDAIDSLRDILHSLQSKRHRIAGKLFRDVLESLNLAAYFYSKVSPSQLHLESWYKDEFVPHSVYREYLKTEYGEEAKNASRQFYVSVSKFTHRSYHILLYGYALGVDNKISYDGYKEDSGILILPQTISMYLATLSNFIFFAAEELHLRGLIEKSIVNAAWEHSLEKETVQRRFKSMREFIEEARAAQSDNHNN
jgi:hypothetical protein